MPSKWTAEEDAALRAGVLRHGLGKWRCILRDPEFCYALHLRSNIDLKDRWRNIMACDREKARFRAAWNAANKPAASADVGSAD